MTVCVSGGGGCLNVLSLSKERRTSQALLCTMSVQTERLVNGRQVINCLQRKGTFLRDLSQKGFIERLETRETVGTLGLENLEARG